MTNSIVFVGGGNMAAALVGGLLKRGCDRRALAVVDVSPAARERATGLGVAAFASVEQMPAADVLILAVKPQQMREVAQSVAGQCRRSLVLSIAAGIRTRDLSRWLGGHQRIVRAMPNTPALVGAGAAGLYAMPAASAADRNSAEGILGAVGTVQWFEREEALDAVTAVSGSGPAYVFYFIEAVEQAARDLGLDAHAARALTLETFAGATQLAAGSEDSPAVLRQKVTSKGGTTERALEHLESAGVRQAIIDSVKAAALRAREMGDAFGAD